MALSAVRDPRASTGHGQRSEALAGYAFIAIPMLLYLVLNIGSIAYAIFVSLFQWNIRSGAGAFIGLTDYQLAFKDPIFLRAISNTLYYTAVWVPLTMAVGLFLAVLVNQKIRGRTFFRAAFYFPSLAASAAIVSIATHILASDGLFNTVLNHLGYHHNNAWFTQESTALPSIIGLNAWTTSGTMMLFYLAALQSIPTDVYEAAAIDGAGAWRTFWKVTFPLLKPAHFFILVVSVIGALQMFDQSFLIGGASGGPNYSTMTVVLYLYNQSIKEISFGYGAAIGVVLFLFLFVVTVIQRLLFGKPEVA